MSKKFITLFLVMAFCLSIVAGCSYTEKAQDSQEQSQNNQDAKLNEEKSDVERGNHYPVTIKMYTNEGKEIEQTIEREPKKVVVIGETMAELVIEFGQKDKVVGVGYLNQSFSKYADQINQMPIITESWPSKEAVLALKPDIIYSISSAFKEELLGDISFWNDRGVPVLSAVNFTIGRSIEEYFTEIKNFGMVFNVKDKTDAYLKEQNSRINKVKKIVQGAKETPRVLFIGSARDTYYYYPPSWCIIDEMIEGAGGEYMKLSENGYIEMSIEAVIATNPEKIIITEFQEPDREMIKNKLISNERLKNVNAIKTGNVMVAEYTNSVNGGLQLADIYEDVATFIHPELFGGKEK